MCHKSYISSIAYSGNNTGSKRSEIESTWFIIQICLCTSEQCPKASIILTGQLLSSTLGTIINYQLTDKK